MQRDDLGVQVINHHALERNRATVDIVVRSSDLDSNPARCLEQPRSDVIVCSCDVAGQALLGDHHAEALRVGEDVQESKMAFVLVDDVARLSTSHDPAEHALPHLPHSGRCGRVAVLPLEFSGGSVRLHGEQCG